MAFELTNKADRARSKINIDPIFVLCIEGIEQCFAIVKTQRVIRIGDPDLEIGDDWVIGGVIDDENSLDYIAKDFTSTRISQQLQPDRGSISSISQLGVRVIDKNKFLSQIISPGVIVDEILGRRCICYMGFKGTAFPQDYFRVFQGNIVEIESGAGWVEFSISHPDEKKRQKIFKNYKTKLNGAINDTTTTINLDDTTGFLLPVAGIFRTFIQIDDEFLEYTGLTPTSITGVTRGALSSINARAVAAAHDDDADASTFYILEDNAIDLALKIMLSGAGYAIENIEIQNFQQTENTVQSNAIYFQGVDLSDDLGLRAGDFITVTGATNGANNFTARTIQSITVEDDGSYCIVSGAALVLESDSAAVAKFKSQYDVLPDGLAMRTDEVDINQHEYLKETFLASPEYQFYLADTIDGKEFIEKQLMVPIGCYTLPRSTRASMQYHTQPLPFSGFQTLSKDNIVKPDELVLRRAMSKNFYNTIIFKYDQDLYDDSKFKSATIITNEDSKNDIGKRQDLVIEAKGIRSTLNGPSIANATISRLLDRYKRGAEYFEGVKVMFGDGVTMEPGDAVFFDPTDLQITNTLDGTRKKPAKFFEIINKDLGLNGDVTISLTDTGFDGSSRIGLFSPASYVIGGSTTAVTIKPSFSKPFGDNEYLKWQPYIGAMIQVRSLDYTTRLATRKLIGVSGNTLLLDTALPFTPVDGDVVEFADYDLQTSDKVKTVYTHNSDGENPFNDGGDPYRYI